MGPVKEELENILNMLYDIIQWKIQYPDEGVDIPQLNDLEKINFFLKLGNVSTSLEPYTKRLNKISKFASSSKERLMQS